MGVISSLKHWASQPFSSQMDLWGWLLFTGLLLIAAAIWSKILGHIVTE